MTWRLNPFTGKLDMVGEGGGGASSWGQITGTISNQLDLQAELNNRVPFEAITIFDDWVLTASIIVYSIAIDATHKSITLTLPSAFGIMGRTYTFKRIDNTNNLVRIRSVDGETIDQEPHIDILFQNTSFGVFSDGTNWLII